MFLFKEFKHTMPLDAVSEPSEKYPPKKNHINEMAVAEVYFLGIGMLPLL